MEGKNLNAAVNFHIFKLTAQDGGEEMEEEREGQGKEE